MQEGVTPLSSQGWVPHLLIWVTQGCFLRRLVAGGCSRVPTMTIPLCVAVSSLPWVRAEPGWVSAHPKDLGTALVGQGCPELLRAGHRHLLRASHAPAVRQRAPLPSVTLQVHTMASRGSVKQGPGKGTEGLVGHACPGGASRGQTGPGSQTLPGVRRPGRGGMMADVNRVDRRVQDTNHLILCITLGDPRSPS